MKITESSCIEECETEKSKLVPTLALPPRNPFDAFFKASDAATPSPLTFVSSLFADQDPYTGDIKSFSQLLAGAIASPSASYLLGDGLSLFGHGLITPTGIPSTSDGKLPSVAGALGDGELQPFSTSAKFKSMIPPRLPVPRSPLLTIPPGLSPTMLLESPNLLSMCLAEPSTTIGTFFFPPLFHEAGLRGMNMPGSCKDGSLRQDGSLNFSFKAHLQLPNSPLASMGPYGLSHQEALALVQAQADSQLSIWSSGAENTPFECASTAPSRGCPASDGPKVLSHSFGVGEPAKEVNMEMSLLSKDLVSSHPLPQLIDRPSEDGFNWRKYGQKQVKGGEYPRSYYKCTHPGCLVKKKVERSYDGQIAEIEYKGEHNHAKPQSTHRTDTSNVHVVGREHNHVKGEHNHAKPQSTCRPDTSNAHVGALCRDLSQSVPLERSTVFLEIKAADKDRCQLGGGISKTLFEPSFKFISEDETDDYGGHDSGSKRRKLEKDNVPVVNPSLTTVREPPVVVQAKSEIDILDDGYRWRKYGCKVVKGNPYPRSYYKCTNPECNVKKHVERSLRDPKSVITSYEGKHNHGVPHARKGRNQAAVATSSSSQPTRHILRGSAPEGGVAKWAISLQEQVFGKLFADGHEVATTIETCNNAQGSNG